MTRHTIPTDMDKFFTRCPTCGSVFRLHTCHALPDWLTLVITRAAMRREKREVAP